MGSQGLPCGDAQGPWVCLGQGQGPGTARPRNGPRAIAHGPSEPLQPPQHWGAGGGPPTPPAPSCGRVTAVPAAGETRAQPGLCSRLIHRGSEAALAPCQALLQAQGCRGGGARLAPPGRAPTPIGWTTAPGPGSGWEATGGRRTSVGSALRGGSGAADDTAPRHPSRRPRRLAGGPREAGRPVQGPQAGEAGRRAPGAEAGEDAWAAFRGEGRPSGAGAGSTGSGLCLKRPLAAAWRQECGGRGSRRPWGLGRPVFGKES